MALQEGAGSVALSSLTVVKKVAFSRNDQENLS